MHACQVENRYRACSKLLISHRQNKKHAFLTYNLSMLRELAAKVYFLLCYYNSNTCLNVFIRESFIC